MVEGISKTQINLLSDELEELVRRRQLYMRSLTEEQCIVYTGQSTFFQIAKSKWSRSRTSEQTSLSLEILIYPTSPLQMYVRMLMCLCPQ